MSDVTLLSGISGLSFDSRFLSSLSFFFIVFIFYFVIFMLPIYSPDFSPELFSTPFVHR